MRVLWSPGMPQLQIERRRVNVHHVGEMEAQLYLVAGFLFINGIGEAIVDVGFHLRFTAKPAMSFGHELAPNQSATYGQFPTASVTVGGWHVEPRGDAEDLYVAAQLLIVVGGKPGQQSIIHWQAQGEAVRNPLTEEE